MVVTKSEELSNQLTELTTMVKNMDTGLNTKMGGVRGVPETAKPHEILAKTAKPHRKTARNRKTSILRKVTLIS